MMRVPAPVRIRVSGDQLNIAVIITSSPMRLGSGGRARFAKFEINHHVAVSGKMICSPRVRIIVRLCARS